MKKIKTILLTAGIFLFGSLNVLGQSDIEIESNGNVKFGDQVIIGKYRFAPISQSPAAAIYINSSTPNGSGYSRYGVYSIVNQQIGTPYSGDCTGLYGLVGNSVDLNPYTPYIGVLGTVNSVGGINVGVAGITQYGTNGAGIYGGETSPFSFPGTYAGYFDGNVAVTGTVSATNISGSDVRFKKDISELNSEKSLKSILMMKPVEYRLEQQYVKYKDDDETIKERPLYGKKSQVFQKKHYGLIAQELQELYPDLVYEVDDNGYLGVNYTEIIPMLIQSVQELNKKIETLEKAGSALKSGEETADIPSIEEITGKAALLYQNIPNPFNQSTEIKFYIPENSKKAQLYIYNLQGKQIKQIVIAERGESSHRISASELTAGMYLYALIVDGKEVDTKRMILTK